MKYAIALLVWVAAASGAAYAGNAALHIEKTVVSKSTFGSNDGPNGAARCDSSGNIYVRLFDSAELDHPRPVLMFDKAGALQTSFVSPHLSEFREFQYEFPFALLPQGGVAVVDEMYPDIHIVKFSLDGEVESDVLLDFTRFAPYQLAVFPSGDLLLSGIEGANRAHPHLYKSFAAIYDKTGHLTKRLSLDGDAEIDQAIEVGDSRYASHGPGWGNLAVAQGMAATGEDGNVYLVRRTSPATVYVISSAGEVIRKVIVEPHTFGDMPFEMQLAKGKMAFVFDGWTGDRPLGNENLAIVDANSGERLQDFEDDPAGAGFFGLSCYAPDSGEFSFVSMSDGKLRIDTAREK